MRWLVTVLLSVCAVTTLVADAEHPFSWKLEKRWTAQVMPLGSMWVEHSELPAWQSSEPVLAVVDGQGVVRRHALDGQDVRTIAVWRNHVLAVRTTDSLAELVILDAELQVLRRAWIPGTARLQPKARVELFSSDSRKHVLMVCNGVLYAVDPLARHMIITVLEQNVFGVCLGSGEWAAAFVHDVGGMAYASFVDTTLQRRVAPSVPLATTARMGQVREEVVVISPVDEATTTQVSIINARTSEVRTLALDVPAGHVTWMNNNGRLELAIVTMRQGRQVLTIDAPQFITSIRNGVTVPPELGTPVRLWSHGDTVVVWCAGGVATVHGDRVISADVLQENLSGYDEFVAGQYTLLASGRSGTMLLQRHTHPVWWLSWLVTVAGPYLVPSILILIVGFLTQRLRRQRRFLDAMLEVPGAGLVLVVDEAGQLLRTNERSAKLLRITANVPMRRLYLAYMRHKGVDGLQAFISNALDVRRPVSGKVSVNDDDDQREYMFTAQPLWGTFGKLRSIVITGIDITEALERRRLVNWAQLAHDMQTNLSTVRLNAEQLSNNMEERDRDRARRILFQTDVLIQRVRDLVSVGRSEDLQRAPIHSAEFCTQLRHEFDPSMFPHVNFVMKLRGTMMNVDKLKLSRAVRNSVENAIKSLRGNEGTVELATWFDRTSVYIRVSDTGVGMDTLTLANMMKPYFTTAKDGSGTGIGTMIMQHVTHMHGGSLRVTSEPGEGTQVVFRIPIMM